MARGLHHMASAVPPPPPGITPHRRRAPGRSEWIVTNFHRKHPA